MTWVDQWGPQALGGKAIKPSHFLQCLLPPKKFPVSLLWISLPDSCALVPVLGVPDSLPCPYLASAWTLMPCLQPCSYHGPQYLAPAYPFLSTRFPGTWPLAWHCPKTHLTLSAIQQTWTDTQYCNPWLWLLDWGYCSPSASEPGPHHQSCTHDIC